MEYTVLGCDEDSRVLVISHTMALVLVPGIDACFFIVASSTCLAFFFRMLAEWSCPGRESPTSMEVEFLLAILTEQLFCAHLQ